MKKKMLIIGIIMNSAGTERSFLSFAQRLDYEKYDVELLLASKEGAFLHLVPEEIKVSEMGELSEIFKINKNNSFSVISKLFLRKNPFFAFKLLPDTIKMRKGGVERAYAANRIWLKLMDKMPVHTGEYDVALAYWGDHTMFYMVDKVNAKKKISWLHFDYDEPPREDAVYLPYLKKCDKIITVSKEIEHSLAAKFPELGGKIETIENFVNEKEIIEKSQEECDFRDDFDGIAILSVGRLCEQKGFDLAIPAVAKLFREGENVRYYIIGEGSEEYKQKLLDIVRESGAENCVHFLPRTDNPYKFMARCDVYLQPSRHEGKPIAVEEAKILCLPMCVTNYKSASEQLGAGNLGVICEISEEGIYNGVKTILHDEDKREGFKAALGKVEKEEITIEF
ncbi:MAG: glycosyltransferase [Clostridia bacterium]|nr:glycosyltransferase [Clostridia bacterium]